MSIMNCHLQLELLLLPPAGRLHDLPGYNATEGLREFVGFGGFCSRRAGAPAVEAVEKQLSFDRHVQLPERIPTTPPEEWLQSKKSTPTDAKGLHGGALGPRRPCAIGVRTRKDLGVEVRVRDLLLWRARRTTKKESSRRVRQSVSLHESILSEGTGARSDGFAVVFERLFIDLQRAAGAPPREPIPYSLEVEADGLMLRHDVFVHLEHVESYGMPFVIDHHHSRRFLAERGT